MSKYVILGGFLGAGKTTTMIAFSEYLASVGKKTAILVNDLGAKHLVDAEFTDASACVCDEISGGCICYQTEVLVDKLRRFRDSSNADIIFSDIPGCGIGALDHVYHKLNREYTGEFEICPFVAVADPERLRVLMPEKADLNLPDEMAYLFDAQLKEAEVILLNKIDLLTQAERDACMDYLCSSYPQAKVFAISAKTGEGIPAAIDYLYTHETAFPVVDIGYGGAEFIAAETCLSWYNRKAYLKAEAAFDGNAFVADLFESIREKLHAIGRNVPHLKAMVRAADGSFAKASLIGVDYLTEFGAQLTQPQLNLQLVVNARAACESGVLDFLMDAALRETVERYALKLQIFFTECFGMMDEGA